MTKKIVALSLVVVGVFTAAFAYAEHGDDDKGIIKGPIKAIEHAIDRLSNFEERELKFAQNAFELGSAPQSLAVNPNGQTRITKGKVTEVQSEAVKVEVWKLSFLVEKTADTKVLAGRKKEMTFAEIKVGDFVDVRGRISETESAVIQAEIINDRTQIGSLREDEINRLRAEINALIAKLNDILKKVGQSPTATTTP